MKKSELKKIIRECINELMDADINPIHIIRDGLNLYKPRNTNELKTLSDGTNWKTGKLWHFVIKFLSDVYIIEDTKKNKKYLMMISKISGIQSKMYNQDSKEIQIDPAIARIMGYLK